MNQLISTRMLAKQLSISIRSVQRYKSLGLLPKPVRVGGQAVRWRQQDIDEWIAEGCPRQQLNHGAIKTK